MKVVEGGASGSKDGLVLVGDDANVAEEEAVQERAHIPRIAGRPYTSSKSEVDAHFPLHLEYRSWCPHCKAGRGISMQHRYQPERDESHLGTTWSLDYCFMTAEEEEDDMRAILVVYDHAKLGLWTLPVEKKGADENVVSWVVGKLEECCYAGTPITLKSDQEPAMMSLKRAIAIRRRTETPLVESPVRESKSNGKIERAIRRWQGQFRTLRHHLEGRLGTKLENSSALIEWLIVWTADMLTKYAIHPQWPDILRYVLTTCLQAYGARVRRESQFPVQGPA